MAHGIVTKDPDSILDWEFNWTSWLAGDTISTSTWVVPSGITKDSDTKTTITTTIWLSSGTDGTDYELVNRIDTAGGRTKEWTLLVRVRSSLTYTIAGRHIVQEIRWLVDDEDSSDFDYPNERINALIEKAVRLYSQYQPFSRKSTLTTVADQDLYALPADCTRLQ